MSINRRHWIGGHAKIATTRSVDHLPVSAERRLLVGEAAEPLSTDLLVLGGILERIQSFGEKLLNNDGRTGSIQQHQMADPLPEFKRELQPLKGYQINLKEKASTSRF